MYFISNTNFITTKIDIKYSKLDALLSKIDEHNFNFITEISLFKPFKTK